MLLGLQLASIKVLRFPKEILGFGTLHVSSKRPKALHFQENSLILEIPCLNGLHFLEKSLI